jgi:hypothetical protein
MPRDQETGVPRDATVLVAASRRVDHHTAAGVRVRSEDHDVEGVIDISSDGRILFWRPARDLCPQAQHQVMVTGVRDERGAPFDDLVSTFVTGVFTYVDFQRLLD